MNPEIFGAIVAGTLGFLLALLQIVAGSFIAAYIFKWVIFS